MARPGPEVPDERRDDRLVTAMPEAPMPDTDALRWQAVLDRDPAPAGGPFLYAVTTQGVYCRPGCPSRPPLRRNVRFYPDVGAAEAAGFRACKRCDPKGERIALHADAVRAACAMIEAAETMPSLADLAARAGYARHHFLRLFRDITGVTPRSYAEGVRARRLQASLAAGDRVAEAVAGAGFGSESRVYEDTSQASRHDAGHGAARRAGRDDPHRACRQRARPAAGRRDGAGRLLHRLRRDTGCAGRRPPRPLPAGQRGPRRGGAGGDGARGRRLHRRARGRAAPCRSTCAARPSSARCGRRCSASRSARLGPMRGWPPRSATRPRCARWRGPARSNPVSLAVPCHRVVGRDGDLTGYRWGVPRKAALLAGEAKARRKVSAG